MIKVFVSQPMTGLPETHIKRAREQAIYSVIDNLGAKPEEVEIIDSYFEDFKPDAHPLEHLGRSIALMAQADVVYFGSGWLAARGCRIENEVARAYGKRIIETLG